MVRVRFAPSPTGYLHIGSARTALFSWLYARHNKGSFLLRIEDTDKVRSKSEFLDEILGSLRWLSMDWDEELVFQSKRSDIYTKFAEELVAKGSAYREGPAIIFKVAPSMKVSFDDIIHGKIEVSSDEIKDQVLIKSDGTPTYNFACVVDDSEMKITHVIRGDDHISNTPKQVLLYEALRLPMPKFAHIPLILSKDGGRLSKRHGATGIHEYKNMGFLPEALVNYLCLMGWAPGQDREIITSGEMIRLFDVTDVNKTGATFDLDKLSWINSQYTMNMSIDELAARSASYLKDRGVVSGEIDMEKWKQAVCLYKARAKTLDSFVNVYKIFFCDEIEFDEKAVNDHLRKEGSKEILLNCISSLDSLRAFDKSAIEGSYRSLAEKMNIKAAVLIHPTRVAISGSTAGAGLFEMMETLGKNKVMARMRKAAAL